MPTTHTTVLRPLGLSSLLALLLAVLPAQAPSSDVSVGVFPFLVGDMDQRINEIVTNCQLRGIDTVYVSVFRTTGSQQGSLWIDDEAGTWPATYGPVRPGGAGITLGPLVAACHAADVRVVGIVKCFDASVQPSDAGHRQYLLDVIDYLLDSWTPTGQPVYDLDGIALDYVRYVGSSNASASVVTNFVASVRERVGALSLHAYLIANRYTFDGPAYNGSFHSYASVQASLSSQYGQDWQQLAPLLDVLLPMAYTADGSIYNSYGEHQAYVAKTAEYARLACTLAGVPGRRVVPAIKTYSSSGETTTAQTIDASATGALLGGGDGYQAFRYDYLVNAPTWWGPLQTHAVPGCNWPTPRLIASAPKLSLDLDPTASSDFDQSNASLLVRYDFDGDAAFDTPFGPSAASATLLRHPGTWTTTMQVRDADGHVATTRRRITTGDPLTVFPTTLNTTAGGNVLAVVDAGPAAAGHTYLVLAGLSGSSPGFVWGPDMVAPLNLDGIALLLASNPNGGVMSNGLGTLDAQGRATATLQWPPQVLSFLAGLPLTWTFVAQDPFTQPSCVGNARVVQLQ